MPDKSSAIPEAVTPRSPPLQRITRAMLAGLCLVTLSACSLGPMVARSSLPILESGNIAMNRETDLTLARAAIPANLKLIEGLIQELPDNQDLRLLAAQGFNGYAFGFVEDEDSARASALYQRGWEHARHALAGAGFQGDITKMSVDEINQQLPRLGQSAVPALFWTASCLAKWIDMNRNDPARLADIGKAAALMERVLALDENYYHGGPHLFFGVYYGARPAMLGGDFDRAMQHFNKARALTQGKLLLVDFLQAAYLDRQQFDRESFHRHLTAVIHAPANLDPDLALVNAVAQEKSRKLLTQEEELF
jgi:hypothetical protein